MKRLLLVSNSTCFGGGYLEHCAAEMEALLEGAGRVLFIPFALKDMDGYAAKARERFAATGRELDSLHDSPDARKAVERAEVIFIGGGNTFRLLNRMYELDLLPVIRRRVERGTPYMGTSAGSNVATLSIRTTNDMPIVQPPSFAALNLVPFNINPHYLDPDPDSTHMGETRETRIREFHEDNEPPVVGLREGAMLEVRDNEVTLLGTTGARLFRRGRLPEEFEPGARLDFLMNPEGRG